MVCTSVDTSNGQWYRVLQKNNHPPTCCHITPDPPCAPLINVAAQCMPASEPKWFLFWRPFQAKRRNNIELGERGHASFFAMSVTGWLFFQRTRYHIPIKKAHYPTTSNNVLLVKNRGSGLIYHLSSFTNPSINQQTNGKRTSMTTSPKSIQGLVNVLIFPTEPLGIFHLQRICCSSDVQIHLNRTFTNLTQWGLLTYDVVYNIL